MIDSVRAPEDCQESPATLSIQLGRDIESLRAPQPYPLLTMVGRMAVGPQVVSSILRRWSPGESRRCRLCPVGSCSAAHDSCMIMTTNPVGTGRDAAMHRSISIRRAEEA